MNVRFQMGGASGPSLMKFTLTYEGELRSNKGPKEKWEIRKVFAPQLEELWRLDPALVMLRKLPYVAATPGVPIWEIHHSADDLLTEGGPLNPEGWVNVCEPLEVGGRKFLPLVRESLALKCGLKIHFLRKEEPGRVYQGGDIDNRLKTLFDALSMPNRDQMVDDPTATDPIHCLLENDTLIAGLAIETGRLLGRPNASKHEVKLTIEVDVRVMISRTYNQLFLGG
jgi:hypothetical protein